MANKLIAVAAVLSLGSGLRGQQDLAGPLEIGSGSGEPGEIVEVPVYGTFDHPLVFFMAPFQFDSDRLSFLSFNVEGTVAAGERMGLAYRTFEAGDGIFGFLETGAAPRDLFRFPPGERQLLGKLRFLVLSAASPGPAFVTPVTRIPETAGMVFFGLDVGDPWNLQNFTPQPLIGGDIDVLPPRGPRPVGDFVCEQFLDRVLLTFTLTEAYDAIEISRDGMPIATLPGTATGTTDPLPGTDASFSYSVIARRGGKASLPASCLLKAHSPMAPTVTEFECDQGRLTWTNPVSYDRIVLFKDGQEIAAIPGDAQGFSDPSPSSSLALYSIVGEMEGFRSPEVNCLDNGVWIMEAGDVNVPVGATRVSVPIFVTNARTINGMGFCLEIDKGRFKFLNDPAGALAGTVGYPQPEFIATGGIGACGYPAAGMIYDYHAPRQPEKYLPVGLRQHVFNFDFKPLGTFAEGETFDVSLITPSFSLPKAISQHPDVLIPGQIRFGTGGPAAVKGLSARLAAGAGGGAAGAAGDVALAWENGSAYEEIRIERNGISLGEIPGGETGFVDAGVPGGIFTYKVVGLSGGESSFPASAFLSTFSPPGTFLRGDANRDRRVDIADAIASLSGLFLGGALPCEDAADADDSGVLDVTDPIYTIRYLLLGGEPIKAPGTAYPWFDPTPDGLGCQG